MELTLHVTDLDGWVWFKRIESMSIEDMRGRLLRTEPPNEKMKMGTAFHSVLENPPDEIDIIEKDGYTFKIDCDAEIMLPQIREVRQTKTYSVSGADVTLTGKTDGITGNKVIDHKLTFNPNPETYFDSYQWRAYLDIYNADVFEYYIYSAKEKKGVVTICDVSTMPMYRYPAMVDDLVGGIAELLEFIRNHVPEMITNAA
jgi:hypothetical protein